MLPALVLAVRFTAIKSRRRAEGAQPPKQRPFRHSVGLAGVGTLFAVVGIEYALKQRGLILGGIMTLAGLFFAYRSRLAWLDCVGPRQQSGSQ